MENEKYPLNDLKNDEITENVKKSLELFVAHSPASFIDKNEEPWLHHAFWAFKKPAFW